VATHFHQLALLGEQQLSRAGCYKLVAEKDKSGIIFTYQIKASSIVINLCVDDVPAKSL
jgi:DNA mismatch repair ATPase MutS